MLGFMSKWLCSFTWSIESARDKLLELDHVYDVLIEQPAEGRHQLHVWHSGGLGAQGVADLSKKIRNVLSRRPQDVKVDVFLYERA